MPLPHSAAELGLMRGTPPPPDRLVTPDNWIEGPFNRWGFIHVRELTRTARIARGDGPVRELPSDPRDLGALPVNHAGATIALTEALARGYSDGICVVHHGAVVFEHRVDGFGASDTHLLMSVSKSLTATLIGVLAGEGLLDPAADVTSYVGALRGTAWDGCTIQHLLDMRAGTRFDEDDYDDPGSDGVLIEQISGYRPLRRAGLPADTYALIAGADNDRPHGGPFKYRSILTDVLAWAAVEVSGMRFPDLLSDRIWSRIGAAHDADVIVDAAGFAAAEGGICATLHDLARFGLMQLERGTVAGRAIVPAAWIDRVVARDDALIAAFGDALPEAGRGSFYHDGWWVLEGGAGIYSGYGINGQQLLIHRPSRTVIARVSTWPARWDDGLSALAEASNRAILAHLAAE